VQVQRKQLLRPEMCTRGRTGGSIAALIGCRWEKEKIGMPCLQMLAYPVTDADMNTDSMKRFTDTPKWRQLDKLIDELAKGKPMQSVLR